MKETSNGSLIITYLAIFRINLRVSSEKSGMEQMLIKTKSKKKKKKKEQKAQLLSLLDTPTN